MRTILGPILGPALCLVTGMLALSACSPPRAITVEQAYVRLPAVARAPAAAYFVLNGGPQDATLLSVGSTVAIRAEMHESMTSGAMTGMKPIGAIPLPAGGRVDFAPRGRHVMLFDVNPGIKRGSNVPLVFQFSDGKRLEIRSVAIAAGDPPPDF